MIYTIGLPEREGMKRLRVDETTAPSKGDLLLLNAVGDRFIWKSISPGKFELCHILPTRTQMEWILRLLDAGGNVITSLVNPQEPITTYIFKDELIHFSDCQLELKDDGFLVEISLFPYAWLSKTEFSSYPLMAYKRYKKCKAGFYTVFEENVPSIKGLMNWGYRFETGHQKGKIIFTPLLNKNFFLNHDDHQIIQSYF